MDTKNDDSAGSDSLDKSLQKKCVVDDVGQGEGLGAAAIALNVGESSTSNGKKSTADSESVEGRPANTTKKQKTEKSVGDGSCSAGGGIGGGGGGSGSVAGGRSGASGTDNTLASTATAQLHTQDESGNTSACASDTATTNASCSNAISGSSGISDTGCSTSDTTKTAPHNAITSNSTAAPSNSNSTSSSNNNNNNNNNNAFETKVKQISKNLKETTLAESAINKKTTTSLEDSNSTSSSSSSSPVLLTPESEQASLSTSVCSIGQGDTSSVVPEAETSQQGANDSIDEHDHRSKKVRFHPDVKENDGGNRVIPKKKKKLKTLHTGGSGDEIQAMNQREDDMDLDEEEELEEEEEFDLAKTIAEAQDYLKSHPLTFVRPYDKSSGRLQNGLLEEEDLPQLLESSEEEDFYENVQPENGVERILGKQIKCGKVEFLLRYADRSGLCWESEEFICKHCPNLLSKYEQNRERRQERLMRHVAKRQNIRQRYTDF